MFRRIGTRQKALRSPAILERGGPFAMALMAQVGFLVHQISLLEPAIAGRRRVSRFRS